MNDEPIRRDPDGRPQSLLVATWGSEEGVRGRLWRIVESNRRILEFQYEEDDAALVNFSAFPATIGHSGASWYPGLIGDRILRQECKGWIPDHATRRIRWAMLETQVIGRNWYPLWGNGHARNRPSETDPFVVVSEVRRDDPEIRDLLRLADVKDVPSTRTSLMERVMEKVRPNRLECHLVDRRVPGAVSLNPDGWMFRIKYEDVSLTNYWHPTALGMWKGLWEDDPDRILVAAEDVGEWLRSREAPGEISFLGEDVETMKVLGLGHPASWSDARLEEWIRERDE